VPPSEARNELTAHAARREVLKARLAAADAPPPLRGLIDAIILTPADGELRIERKGNLAAMLSATTNAKRSPETGDLSLQVEMVAGACNRHYLQLCRSAS